MEFTKEQKLYGEIVQKAWEDAQFKSELIVNPAAAIEKLTGKKIVLPEGKTLVVRDQTDEGTIYVNIPAKTSTEDIELNEDQLEAVSGGAFKLPDPFITKLPDIVVIDLPGGPIEPGPCF